MTIEAVRELATRLQVACGAYAALGAALDAYANGREIATLVKDEIGRLLAIHATEGILDSVPPDALQPVIAEIRTTLYHGANLAGGQTRAPGWLHTEAEVLRDQGTVSAAFPAMWKQNVIPRLEGLADRLEAGGAFLDVGVGVAAIAIAMARIWPKVRVVGIDFWQPALAIARENIRTAKLEHRIQLREQPVQELSDSGAFDLVWLPVTFIGTAILHRAVERIWRALRPGGWLLIPCINPSAPPTHSAFVRLRTTLWGGTPLLPTEGEALLKDAEYVEPITLGGALNAFNVMVAGRRP
jgi:ubiquinone/menaquinone biosynthesis C-methylase UbiE